MRAESTRAIEPHALGEDMDVPLINSAFFNVQFGTDAMAPPGAQMDTPKAPSGEGPRDDHVNGMSGCMSMKEYAASIIAPVT